MVQIFEVIYYNDYWKGGPPTNFGKQNVNIPAFCCTYTAPKNIVFVYFTHKCLVSSISLQCIYICLIIVK